MTLKKEFIRTTPWVRPYILESPNWEEYKKQITRETEVNKLRKEVKELKKLIKAAKIYDKETGQPECEVEEKVQLIRRLAELLGVEDVI